METTSDLLATIPGAPAANPQANGGAAERESNALQAAKAKFQELLASQKANETPDIKKAPKEPKPAEKPKAPVKAAAPAEAAPKKDPEIEKLRTKLRLAGHPQKAIEHLADTEIREWWTLQEQRERDAAEVRERAASLQKTSKTTSESEHGVPTEGLDLDEVAEEIGAQFGEDETSAIRRGLEKLMAPALNRIEQLEAVIRQAQEKGRATIVDQNRARLSEKVPQLKNDKAWQLITAQAEAAAKADPKAHASPDGFFDDVVEALYPDAFVETVSEPEPDTNEALKAQIAASAPTPPESKRSTRKASPMDAALAVFSVLKKDPEDVDGARRAGRRLMLPQ